MAMSACCGSCCRTWLAMRGNSAATSETHESRLASSAKTVIAHSLFETMALVSTWLARNDSSHHSSGFTPRRSSKVSESVWQPSKESLSVMAATSGPKVIRAGEQLSFSHCLFLQKAVADLERRRASGRRREGE